jgi:hypothetical protein
MHREHRLIAVGIALTLFAVWSLATWFLEGRIGTLLRPHAAADRAIYAIVANLLIGIAGGVAVLWILIRRMRLTRRAVGFGSRTPSLIHSLAALILGSVFHALQGPPSLDPIILVNAYAQVLVVSTAEVIICWSVLGATVEALLKPYGRAIAISGAAIAASAAFGLYHFAHSPPFNTSGMVALLTVVGLVTSTFFFITRDAYATVLFHNFLGMFGVIQALASSGRLNELAVLQPPLLIMALATLAVVALCDRALVRKAADPSCSHSSPLQTRSSTKH